MSREWRALHLSSLEAGGAQGARSWGGFSLALSPSELSNFIWFFCCKLESKDREGKTVNPSRLLLASQPTREKSG